MSRFVQILGYLALLLLCLDAAKLEKFRKSKENAVKVMGDNSDDESKSVETPIDFKEIAINITKNVGMEIKVMMEEWKDQMGDWQKSMVDIKDNEKEGKEEKGKNSNGKLKEFLELINLSEGIMQNNTRTWICNTLRELRAPDALIVLGDKKELEVMERVINLINGIGPGGNGPGVDRSERKGPGGDGPERNGPGGNAPAGKGPGGNGPGGNGPEGNGPGGNGPEGNGPGGNGPGGKGPGGKGPGGNGPEGNGSERNGPGGNGPGGNGPGGKGPGGKGPGGNGPGGNGPGANGPEGNGPGGNGSERNGPGGNGPGGNGPGGKGPGGNGPGGNGPRGDGRGSRGPGGNGPENASDRFRRNVDYPLPHKMKERLSSDYSDIIHERLFYNFMIQYCGF